jgi:PAS domain S-box-containing protein
MKKHDEEHKISKKELDVINLKIKRLELMHGIGKEEDSQNESGLKGKNSKKDKPALIEELVQKQTHDFLLKNVDEVVTIMDLDYKYIYVSSSIKELTGYSIDEIKNISFRDSLTDDSYKLVIVKYKDEQQSENISDCKRSRTFKMDMELKCKNGSTIWSEVNSTFIRDEKNKPVSILSIIKDITTRTFVEEEKKQLTEQLKQSQKMEAIGRLAGSVAHDFNNILTGIIGYSEMILSSLHKEDPLAKNINVIKSAGEKASILTHQILSFSQQHSVTYQVTNLNEVIKNSTKLMERIVGEDIKLKIHPCEDLGSIMTDLEQLDQIFVNMALKAKDSMPNGGKLIIETENIYLDKDYYDLNLFAYSGEYVKLSISDTGNGMDSQTQKLIFEPFFKTELQKNGTGLGLYTVYDIIKQNHGFINVYSEVGIGTTFTLHFPKVGPKLEQITIADSQKIPLTGNETILLVDDDNLVRELMKTVLERQGYHILVAEDGVSAIEMYRKYSEKINLLLTDVVMPNMNGKELYAEILKENKTLKVVFMSGYTENVVLYQGMLKENENFIQKPFQISALVNIIQKVLKT